MKFKKKMHIIMSIISSLLLIGTIISAVLLILGYNNNDIAIISFDCFICALIISLGVHFAIIWTININIREILTIDRYVTELKSNEQLCKVCLNYADSHEVPVMALECMFLPFVYGEITKKFKLSKLDISDFNTDYLKQLKISYDAHFDFSETIFNEKIYIFSGKYKDLNHPLTKVILI